MWRGRGTLPPGQSTCRPCRQARREQAQQAETIHQCEYCHRTWTRPRTKGQVPRWCPDCRLLWPQTRACSVCGVEQLLLRGRKRCEPCAAQAERERIIPKLPVKYVAANDQTRTTITHVSTAHRLTSGRCRVCDTWFVSEHLDVTCSEQCRTEHHRGLRQAHKDRRRARKRGAYRADVYRKKVFEADGYRCHLCGKKTNPRKQAPHPKSPTVDHLVPLAAGGTHEPSNCRTACFLCNAVKGNRGGGEQFALAW